MPARGKKKKKIERAQKKKASPCLRLQVFSSGAPALCSELDVKVARLLRLLQFVCGEWKRPNMSDGEKNAIVQDESAEEAETDSAA